MSPCVQRMVSILLSNLLSNCYDLTLATTGQLQILALSAKGVARMRLKFNINRQ